MTLLADFGEKITSLAYSRAFDNCKKIVVGGENGKIGIYDISDKKTAKKEQEFKVEGKIVAMQQYRTNED